MNNLELHSWQDERKDMKLEKHEEAGIRCEVTEGNIEKGHISVRVGENPSAQEYETHWQGSSCENANRIAAQPLLVEVCCNINDKNEADLDYLFNSTNCDKNKNCSSQSATNRHLNGTTKMIPLFSLPSKYNVYIAVFAVNLSAVAAGCILAWSSPTLPKITQLGEKIFITKDEGTWVSSIVALGSALGPFIAGAVVDKIGRKWTILMNMLLFLISWTMIAIINDVRYMYFARFLAGIGVGCVFTVLPMYVAEISPVNMRGALGSLMQFSLCTGFIVAYCVGPFTSFLTLVLASACAPLFCILLFVWIPESPLYLITRGRKQDAYNALEWMRGYPDKLDVQNEIAEMQVTAEESNKEEGNIISLLNSKGNIKALYYSCALVFFQQMSGINVVLFYSETIFEATGSSLSPSISTIIIGLVMLATASLTAPGAKLVGVKNLLIFSAIGETASTAVLGFYFFLQTNHADVSALGWLPVTSLVIFIITYSIGFGPFVWVIMAEIFPSHLKAIASALTASFCWILAFVLTKYFSAFTEKVGTPYAFWLFSLFSLLSLIFVLAQLPDTQNKTFGEIQEMLHGRKVNMPTEKA